MHLVYFCGLIFFQALLSPAATLPIPPDIDEQPVAARPFSARKSNRPKELSPDPESENTEGTLGFPSDSSSPASGDDPPSLVANAQKTTQDDRRDSQEIETEASDSEDEVDDERPRAIVDIRREGLGGEVSYIIHPDNQPPPTYEPLKDLPPPTRPVAKWRPDIFMKICCSEPEANATTENSGDDVKSTENPPDSELDKASNQTSTQPDSEEKKRTEGISEAADEDKTTTPLPEGGDGVSSTQKSSDSDAENSLVPLNNSEVVRPEAASNHTPRYEEASTSPYQDVANFLKDIASSEGFQNAFLGDLIKNFGSLDQNALKLIYSLLIRPLEESYKKEDRLGVVEDTPPVTTEESESYEDTVVLSRDRLPLRDRPDSGFQPLKTSFLHSRPSEGAMFPIRPSLPVRPMAPLRPSDQAWRPGRTYDRPQSVSRRGEEGVDVITAPPAKTFEVVLGSSLSHDDKQQRESVSRVGPSNSPSSASSLPLPFDKLTLGLEMPPPEALEALPPGSILIPPSHILGRPNLPKILPPRTGGAPTLEMPLPDFLPNLPFRPKTVRTRPSVKAKAQDIPLRQQGFLSSLRPPATPPTRPPRPAAQPPRRVDTRPHFPFALQPTGPPPIVTKRTPPAVPTVPLRRPHHLSGSSSLYPYLSPPPPPPLLPPLPRGGTVEVREHNLSPGTLARLENSDGYDGSVGTDVRDDSLQPDYMADRNEDYRGESKMRNSEGHQRHRPPHDDYYSDVSSEYHNSYYDLDYEEYYEDDGGGTVKDEAPPGSSGPLEQRPFIHEASATFLAAEKPRTPAPSPSSGTTSSLDLHVMGGGQSEDHFPAGTDGPLVHYPSLDDLLGVVKPNFSTPTTNDKESNEIQTFLQNHRPAASPSEEDSTSDVTPNQRGDTTAHRPLSVEEGNAAPTLEDFWTGLEPHQITEERGTTEQEEKVPANSDFDQREHDASVSHLWKNVQLIPLTPDLFESPEQPEDNETMNLTSLFDAAVPLAPGAALDTVQDLSSDVERIIVDHSGVRVTVTEDVIEDPEKADARFMAYVLIGACCGLALLSITGVIIIVRFKKTCGSRQIKTRTRLTEQDSLENISRHGSHLTPAEESGHKLGSWFTGRNEHIGSGKLRGNMALPTVHDHKREKKGISSSTRDLLSISSQSSPSSSPRQERRDSETAGKAGEEEPRASWLHGEYRASEDEVSHAAPGHDPHYRLQQQQAASSRRHSADHHAYRAESSAEAEFPSKSRGTRERRYTGHSRDGERPSHSPSRRGPRYFSSLDSEELEDRMGGHGREYPTDSELDDGTTHYDGESREPSRYFSDSRELDDVVCGHRTDLGASMTSQELGEHISRDLKQYQSRREGHHRQAEEREPRDGAGRVEVSSQELESEESRELRRSQSQVSFSRDNVQNEVFLEFDSMLRQHGQYLGSDPPASTLGRVSLLTNDTQLSASRANTPDSIDLPEDFPQNASPRRESEHSPSSPPTTPPRFSPPPAPPRPPKPGHLSQAGTPSPQAGRGRPPSPGQSPPSPPSSSQRPVHWTSEEERLI